mgnify:CR=1 FL=1
MADDIYSTVDVITSDQVYTTVETQTIAEVTTIGIQGLTGADGSAGTIESISNVDSSNLENGSLLIYNLSRTTWVASRLLEEQDITGGQF